MDRNSVEWRGYWPPAPTPVAPDGSVDEAALVSALRNGTIAAAGLDVYENEPHLTPGLTELPNVVLLPHLGSATFETRCAMGFRALDNLDAFFAGGEPPYRVNR